MESSPHPMPPRSPSALLAWRSLRGWTARQAWVAAGAAALVGVVLGLATVLIPNSFFTREIPPVWWNYPVWILTSVFSGMLVATYVRGRTMSPADAEQAGAGQAGDGRVDEARGDAAAQRTSRLGIAGGLMAWFAVGCPVCNKLALLALGYSGAITWFAPLQPFLAIGALLLTGIALVGRLRGQLACPVPAPVTETAR